MELALLVYAVSLLSSISGALGITIGILIVWVLIHGFYAFVVTDTSYRHDKERAATVQKIFYRGAKWKVWTIIAMSTIITFLPSEKTAYVMIGAYTAQAIYEDPDAKRIGGKAIQIIEKKMDEYINERTDAVKVPE